MELVISLFCFLIFLFCLYILGKDDYYLMRKNFFIEHLFDFVFAGFLIGLILGRVISVGVHSSGVGSFLVELFSLRGVAYTLTDLVLGCFLSFYLIGKYQRLPLERLFDLLSLAFLTCLPVWYFLNAFLLRKNEVIIYIALGFCYLVVAIIFWRVLLPRIINDKHREGSLSSLFLIMFSFLTLIASFVHKLSSPGFVFEVEDILLSIMFLASFVYLFRIEKMGMLVRRK